jgi:hypothetical protein
MTFGRLDCWKKQKLTHEIATKNTKSHTPNCKKTQSCTPKTKNHILDYRKNCRITHAKAQNCKPNYSKKQPKKITYQITAKIAI